MSSENQENDQIEDEQCQIEKTGGLHQRDVVVAGCQALTGSASIGKVIKVQTMIGKAQEQRQRLNKRSPTRVVDMIVAFK